VEILFKWYLYGCYIVGIVGLVQFISYQIGFNQGYDLRWIGFNKWGYYTGGNFGIRVNSVFGEPTYYATCVSAGAFVSIFNLIVRKPFCLSKLQSIIVIVPYALSFSGVAFMAILFSIVVLLMNFGFIRYVVLFVPVLFGAFYFLYNNVREFRERYDSTIDIFTTGHFSIGKTHGSSIILYDNYQVALKNFSNNYLLGSGLGSHPIAFEKYSVTKDIGVYGISQNSKDASSMLMRLISETGLFGAGLMLFVFFGCFVKRNSMGLVPEHFWIISGALFVLIAVNLLRQGNYFLNGFPFFIWLYYYNHVNYKKYINEISVKEVNPQPISSLPSAS
jgi:hypothetical protein